MNVMVRMPGRAGDQVRRFLAAEVATALAGHHAGEAAIRVFVAPAEGYQPEFILPPEQWIADDQSAFLLIAMRLEEVAIGQIESVIGIAMRAKSDLAGFIGHVTIGWLRQPGAPGIQQRIDIAVVDITMRSQNSAQLVGNFAK